MKDEESFQLKVTVAHAALEMLPIWKKYCGAPSTITEVPEDYRRAMGGLMRATLDLAVHLGIEKPIEQLIEESSLGTSEVKEAIGSVDPAVVEEVLRRADELDRKTIPDRKPEGCPLCNRYVPQGLKYCGSLCSQLAESKKFVLCRSCMTAFSKEQWTDLLLEGQSTRLGKSGIEEYRTCQCGTQLMKVVD